MGSYPDTDVDPLFFFGIDSLDISPYTSSNSSCIKETRRMKNINKGIFFDLTQVLRGSIIGKAWQTQRRVEI